MYSYYPKRLYMAIFVGQRVQLEVGPNFKPRDSEDRSN
jgi:hypothetical protein